MSATVKKFKYKEPLTIIGACIPDTKKFYWIGLR